MNIKNLSMSFGIQEIFDDITLHINDNDGLQDLHLAVGDGKIDWSVLENKDLIERDPSVLIEVSGKEKLENSLKTLRKMRFI